MTVQIGEHALQATILKHLAKSSGYKVLKAAEFHRDDLVFRGVVMDFLLRTQGKVMARLGEVLGERFEEEVIQSLRRDLDAQGTLNVLRKGFKVRGKRLKMAYWQPASTKNPETLEDYEANVLGVTEELKYSTKHENRIDIVISVNGLPVFSAELKNELTGQDYRDAIHQYQRDRSPQDAFFGPKEPSKAATRCLVHFAVDEKQAWYTTKLNGEATYFLPFNKGNLAGKHTCAGNPPVEGKHMTHYLWEDLWQRDSVMQLLQKFLHVERKQIEHAPNKYSWKETLLFPRYHQRDCVNTIVAASMTEGAGKKYLVQHSAGSGKSNSIAWLAYRLNELHDANDEKVFDSVIVITDRRVLDAQLRTTITQFASKMGVVEGVDKDSKQLAEALEKGNCIVITTLQKFPFVTRHLNDKLADRKYAVIVDEAHSGQSGKTATKMKEVLRGKSLAEAAEAEAVDEEEQPLMEQALARGIAPNISYYAFTATPKGKTLGLFGRPGIDGKPEPFHVYSMRQAIEEGFILDVLRNYTTYQTYFGLITENEAKLVDKKRGSIEAVRYAKLHPTSIAQKIAVIVEHYRNHVKHLIGGRAKAMIVTDSRLAAVHYKRSIDAYLQEKGITDCRALVAFSGKVIDDGPHGDGGEYTEVSMNPAGVTEGNLPKEFEDNYQVLIVAEKYQTGFDQPLLVAMYVDKKLSNVHAVQTLSRLNRTHPGKDCTFVLDFVNKAEDIQSSFQPFYETTVLAEAPDYAQISELVAQLESMHVIDETELEDFKGVFYASKGTGAHAKLYRCFDSSKKNFLQLEAELQDKFRSDLKAFLNLYTYLAQIIDYADPEHEVLYDYGRMLWKQLPKDPKVANPELDDDLALKYHRIQKAHTQDIELHATGSGEVSGPTEVGTKTPTREEVELQVIVEAFNARFSTDFTVADQCMVDEIAASPNDDPQLVASARNNTMEDYANDLHQVFDQLVADRHSRGEEFVEKIFLDDRLKKVLFEYVVRKSYLAAREGG